ncbi:uncharacterized protein DUF4238 [Mucilaginibacter frigoritolerans]|uniref:Uncharacterized protein DUF4238 n=1 Tax=Mucilaginibacter frigoritolerans TaxID=652788 RepID=A0A562TYR6_9SPHI|nr:DUF4238 domain-containing protein [Mucilaginibacter frigoritolerans]TWI98761.1 uncharacterized protein DUF4238 [Mucilaginibacter frigoritolerans]
MKQISKKHHYIPQFYLRNFTNDENKFHVYLVKENRYKANGKLFSPETHFFEKNGNTLFIKDEPTDFLETDFYGDLDNDVAQLFNKIKYSTEERHGLTEADMPMLQFFVAHLFWRNPSNDEFVKDLLQRKGLSGLGLNISDTNTKQILLNSKFEKEIVGNESSYKIIKYWLPFILFQNLIGNNSPLTILRFNPGEKPSLISDNPLILRNPQNCNVYKDDFILPLSGDKVLIRTKKLKPLYHNMARVLIDHLLIKQANNFISTTDMRYIPQLNEIKKDISIEELRRQVFACLVE